MHIFTNYYCFFCNNEKESLAVIAQNVFVTKERIRQIAVRLLTKLKGIIKTYNNGYYSIENYFQKEYFIVSQGLTDTINRNENTNFSWHLSHLFYLKLIKRL